MNVGMVDHWYHWVYHITSNLWCLSQSVAGPPMAPHHHGLSSTTHVWVDIRHPWNTMTYKKEITSVDPKMLKSIGSNARNEWIPCVSFTSLRVQGGKPNDNYPPLVIPSHGDGGAKSQRPSCPGKPLHSAQRCTARNDGPTWVDCNAWHCEV